MDVPGPQARGAIEESGIVNLQTLPEDRMNHADKLSADGFHQRQSPVNERQVRFFPGRELRFSTSACKNPGRYDPWDSGFRHLGAAAIAEQTLMENIGRILQMPDRILRNKNQGHVIEPARDRNDRIWPEEPSMTGTAARQKVPGKVGDRPCYHCLMPEENGIFQ